MEPLNGFQANAAPSEAAGLPAACPAKLLACAGMGRAAKRQSFFELPSLRSVARWPGCGLQRQVPCRRRLHNPQREALVLFRVAQLAVPHECAARCAGLGAGCGGKYHVDGVHIILSHKAGGRPSAA